MKGFGTEHTAAPSTDEEILRAIGATAASSGLSPAVVLKSLKTDLRRTPHPRRALVNFHRFLNAGFSTSWLHDFQEHRLLQQMLLELFAQSQYLADILVRNPELFRWLTISTVLKSEKSRDNYRTEASDAAGLFQRLEKKVDALKRFQRRELLRIGARQILNEADVGTCSAELSDLADAIVHSVLEISYSQTMDGLPARGPRDLAVIGLGKLGGEELNFSSDIDLMFVYENDGPLEPPIGRMSTLHEYYCRIAEFAVKRLSEHTGEGHLYRVDMRLRPDGSSGPLAMSRAAYLSYYEARGETWERQMLIKARVIAGNKDVGDRWLADLQPFIFPKTLLTSPLDEIARIKTRIELRVGEGTNIKLGAGGIRDVEFSVQALQLLNGGVNPALRQCGTVPAIRQLAREGHLTTNEGRFLESAYYALRTVEDRLQLLHGLQEHSLPESAEERTILAWQLGFGSAKAFANDLEKHQSNIRKIYQSVFLGKKSGQRGGADSSERAGVDEYALKRRGFIEPAAAEKAIASIVQILPELSRPDQLRNLMDMVQRQKAPDSCLANVLLLSSSVPIRRSLQQLLGSQRTLEWIVLLCSRTSRYASMLAREPLLFESLAGRPEDILGPTAGWDFLRSADPVRYRLYNEFKFAARYIVGETTIGEFTRELSQLAQEILREAFERSVSEHRDSASIPLALMALGKLGGNEMSIGSDLDLVLLYKENGVANAAKTAIAVGRKMRELLSGVYEVDFRLRPEGKNSPLATEFGYYNQYLLHRASLWERQSLIKARIVAGEASFCEEATRHLADFVYSNPLPARWQRDILDMRKRMASERSRKADWPDLKVGKGGLADLEFLVQSMQLRHGGRSTPIRQPNTFEAIALLQGAKLLKSAEAKTLRNNYEYFRRLEAAIRMNSESTDFVLPTEPIQQQAIAAAMEVPSTRTLEEVIRKRRRENSLLLTSVIKSALA